MNASHSTPKPSASAPVWSRLWQTGVLHSCATGFTDNYSGEIAAFWRNLFYELHEGARIVDIGTGNGALPLLARQVAKERNVSLEIHGIDYADIDPAAAISPHAKRYEGIHFHPRTSATSLPFEDASVDIVTSQYAFEYMPRDATLDELSRINTKNGTIALMFHSDDSLISQLAPIQHAACDFVIDDIDLFGHTEALLRILETAKTPTERAALESNPQAETVRAAFNRSAQALTDEIRRVPNADVLQRAAIHARNILMASEHSLSEAFLLAERARSYFVDEQARLQQLRTSIQDESARFDLSAAFEKRGYRTAMTPMELTVNAQSTATAPPAPLVKTRMGWTLVAHRG